MARGFDRKLDQQQAPAFFVRGPSAFARLVFFSALSLALIATDTRLKYMSSLRQSLMAAMHPLQELANAPMRLYDDAKAYFSTHQHLLNENERLTRQSLTQAIALQKLNTVSLENENLRNLLQASKALKESSVLGEIMYVGRDLFTKKIVVNRGETHQVVAGEAVVDAAGVIGQVTRVYPLSSEVTLITDKSLAIPIQIERNGLRAIAFGHGRDNTLDLPFLPTNVDIRRGDTLVTSGIDGVYPAGLSVAKVSQIEITPDSPFARIICVPTGGVENHRQVLLVSIPQLQNSLLESESTTNTLEPNAKANATKKAAQITLEKTLKSYPENTPTKQTAMTPSSPHAPE